MSEGNTTISKAVLDHLNTWPAKPKVIGTKLEKDTISLMMQPLPGEKKLRKYIDGSFIGGWPFAVYIRIPGKDTASRLDANQKLTELSDWLEANPLNSIGLGITEAKFYTTSLPSQAAQFDNGTEDYQVILQLQYHKRRA